MLQLIGSIIGIIILIALVRGALLWLMDQASSGSTFSGVWFVVFVLVFFVAAASVGGLGGHCCMVLP